MDMKSWIELVAFAISPLVLAYILRPSIDNKYLTLTDSTEPRLEEDFNLFADFLEKVRASLKEKRSLGRRSRNEEYDPTPYHEDLAEVGLKPTSFNLDEIDLSKCPKKKPRAIIDGEVFFEEGGLKEGFTVKHIKGKKAVVEIEGKTTIITEKLPVEILGDVYVPSIEMVYDYEAECERPALVLYYPDDEYEDEDEDEGQGERCAQ